MNPKREPLDDHILRNLSEHEELVPLRRAHPHGWGQGKIHQIDLERDQTLCGQSPAQCPGTKFRGTVDKITCKICLRSIDARVKAAAWREQHDREQREWEERHQEGNRRWWDACNAYLSSPAWHAKRPTVLCRANGCCEGCGERRAVQVHHLRYP